MQDIQDDFGYTPVHDRAGPSNAGLLQVPASATAMAAESRKRLAGCYVSNPNAYVSKVSVKPSPTRQVYQVVITLEMPNVL